MNPVVQKLKSLSKQLGAHLSLSLIEKTLIVTLVTASTATLAKEYAQFPSGKQPKPGDWTKADRVQYLKLSRNYTSREIQARLDRQDGMAWSFLDAARYNTIKLAAKEYDSISQRHAYYDLISYVIENDRNTPKAVREVKFFHAATAVTSSLQIGAVDNLDLWDKLTGAVFKQNCITLSDESRTYLKSINEELFVSNMAVIRRLLFEWKAPRSPLANRNQNISAIDFDLEMVDFEQGKVEEYVTLHPPSNNVRSEISGAAENCLFRAIPSINPALSIREYLAAIGLPNNPPFFSLDARKAIGKAWIAVLHKKSVSDYVRLMKK